MSDLLIFWHSENLKNPAKESIIITFIRKLLMDNFLLKKRQAIDNCSTVIANFFLGLCFDRRLIASRTCFTIELPVKFTFMREWKYLIADTVAYIAVTDLPF